MASVQISPQILTPSVRATMESLARNGRSSGDLRPCAPHLWGTAGKGRDLKLRSAEKSAHCFCRLSRRVGRQWVTNACPFAPFRGGWLIWLSNWSIDRLLAGVQVEDSDQTISFPFSFASAIQFILRELAKRPLRSWVGKLSLIGLQ